MKKFLCIILFLSLLICCFGCTSKSNDNIGNNLSSENHEEEFNETYYEDLYDEDTYNEDTDDEEEGEPLLSDDCDYIIADGLEDDNYYELVANEEEDYSGIIIKVGVIKNNKWLIKPTQNSPLVDKDGTFKGPDADEYDDVTVHAYYIGNGCFFYRGGTKGTSYVDVAFNVEKNISYCSEPYNGWHPDHKNFLINQEIKEYGGNGTVETEVMTDCGKYILLYYIHYSEYGEAKILNLDNMKTKIVKLTDIPYENRQVYPMSKDGLFAIYGYHYLAFYNHSGKKVIDVSKYELAYKEQEIQFRNGECTFLIKNNGNSIYEITLDKKGKVIDSVKFDN